MKKAPKSKLKAEIKSKTKTNINLRPAAEAMVSRLVQHVHSMLYITYIVIYSEELHEDNVITESFIP